MRPRLSSTSGLHINKLQHVESVVRPSDRRQSCMVHNLLNIDPLSPDETSSAPPELCTSEETHLSKDSLSEMVMSVRDLSKNLSNLSMKVKLKNVLIVSKIHDSNVLNMTTGLVEYLLGLENHRYFLYVQDVLKQQPAFDYEKLSQSLGKDINRLKFWDLDFCRQNPNMFDMVITLGGDGTVLYTSWLFQKVVPPVLCFSLGSLGFMTEFDFSEHDKVIPNIIKNGLRCSLRMRFECTIMRAKSVTNKHVESLNQEIGLAADDGDFSATHDIGETFCVLNDVVVDRGPNATITTTELYGNCQFLTAMEADGLVIATPSGSTAYSMSAGGSLVHPDIPGVLISPICPHTLSFRPLVLPDSLMVKVGVPYDARSSAWCSFDGKSRVELNKGDFVTISGSRFPFPIIQDGSGTINWLHRLSKTLHWNERQRQQPFSY